MLREPDVADAGPADVYSLAKTLWALASGQRYPPEGQIRVDVADHDLWRWTGGGGTVALGLILERATGQRPEDRPTMAELAAQLEEWAQGGAARDDVASGDIRRRYVEQLGDSLAESLDSKAFPEVQEQIQKILAEARKRNDERELELRREAWRKGKASRKEFAADYGVRARSTCTTARGSAPSQTAASSPRRCSSSRWSSVRTSSTERGKPSWGVPFGGYTRPCSAALWLCAARRGASPRRASSRLGPLATTCSISRTCPLAPPPGSCSAR